MVKGTVGAGVGVGVGFGVGVGVGFGFGVGVGVGFGRVITGPEPVEGVTTEAVKSKGGKIFRLDKLSPKITANNPRSGPSVLKGKG